MPTVPVPGRASKAATTARAFVTASAVGVNTSLITGTWAGWIAILPVKPSRRASTVSRPNAAMLRKSAVIGVDRLYLRRSGAGETERARELIGCEEASDSVAIHFRAELDRQILGAPGKADRDARLRPA